MRLPTQCRFQLASTSARRLFSSSSQVLMPRRRSHEAMMQSEDKLADFDIEDIVEPGEDDTSSAGHKYLQQQRELLYYMRLIEHEMPKLVAFRKPFIPPDSRATPIVVRSISFAGEQHPVTAKRVIVVPVADLPLKNDIAIHKMKLLAGVRWSPIPPADSGVIPDEESGKHGYIKISCEDFPKPAMNLKWASDALDRMIAEANNHKRFANLPVDTRHLVAKASKAKRGGGKTGARPSIWDFPQEWLDPSLAEPPVSKTE